MADLLHHRIGKGEEVLHTALCGVLVSPQAPSPLFVAILFVCVLLFSRAA